MSRRSWGAHIRATGSQTTAWPLAGARRERMMYYSTALAPGLCLTPKGGPGHGNSCARGTTQGGEVHS